MINSLKYNCGEKQQTQVPNPLHSRTSSMRTAAEYHFYCMCSVPAGVLNRWDLVTICYIWQWLRLIGISLPSKSSIKACPVLTSAWPRTQIIHSDWEGRYGSCLYLDLDIQLLILVCSDMYPSIFWPLQSRAPLLLLPASFSSSWKVQAKTSSCCSPQSPSKFCSLRSANFRHSIGSKREICRRNRGKGITGNRRLFFHSGNIVLLEEQCSWTQDKVLNLDNARQIHFLCLLLQMHIGGCLWGKQWQMETVNA